MDIRSRFDRQQKSDASGYRMLRLGIVGVIAQILLIFLASQLPGSGVYYASIVNLCSFLGLLVLFEFFLYWHGFLPIRQWAPYSRPCLWNLSHRFPPRQIFVQHTRGSKDACIAAGKAPAYSIVPSDATLHQLKIAVETMRLGVTITDIQGKILYTNPAEARMHGYCVEELLGKDLGILAPAELRNPMTPDQISQMKGLRESVNIRKNGSRFPVQLLSDVIRDDYARPIAVVTTCEDITERKRLEKLMKQRTRELTLLNRMSDVLQACRNEHDTYHVIREICQKLFPLESGCLCMMDSTEPYLKVVEFWGTPPHNSFVPSQTEGSCSDDISRLGNLCPYQNVCTEQDCLCVPISASGEMLGLLSLCFRPDADSNQTDPYYQNPKAKQTVLTRVAEHYALSLLNLRLRETLRLESIRDPLTGLFNRRYMEESLEREARRAERHDTSIGIIMSDIDHFKQLNDHYGHDAGDMVLRELGAFLQQNTRGEDIACRYGGEEFLLILPEVPFDTVLRRANDLHMGVNRLKIVYQGQPLHITISVGVALLPHHSTNVRNVVKAADTALYTAKNTGRNQVVVAPLNRTFA